ncbi:MAG: hypothetical protein K9I68_08275 [Bacteroidales bacterium]|nr:hypothetical protein [Bacteroidales bacterium]MCF8338076.1 hypothetical protein [Bacteroidales bacterium]
MIKEHPINKVLVSLKAVRLKPLFFCPLLVFVLLTFSQPLSAQNEQKKRADTVRQKISKKDSLEKKHSPQKAALYSAALPGLGQAYNEKYWKIPIIYAGFGTLAYFINQNNTEYNKFKDAYTFVSSEETGEPPNEYVDRYENKDDLRKLKDYYRRNLELSYILTGALYILNIIDASVDAHFFEFNVDKDLSLEVSPYIDPNIENPAFATNGVSISLNL